MAIEHRDGAGTPVAHINFRAVRSYAYPHRSRPGRQREGLQHLERRRVEDIQLPGGFRGNETRAAVRQKGDAPRPAFDFEMAHRAEIRGVDAVHVATGFTGHIEEFSIGRRGHPFRLLADRNDVFEFLGRDVDDGRGFRVLV